MKEAWPIEERLASQAWQVTIGSQWGAQLTTKGTKSVLYKCLDENLVFSYRVGSRDEIDWSALVRSRLSGRKHRL